MNAMCAEYCAKYYLAMQDEKFKKVKEMLLAVLALYLVLSIVFPEYAVFAKRGATINESIGTGGGTSLPWEDPLIALQNSLTGPVAKAIAMMVVVVAGVFVALGEGGPAGRMVGRLVFGLGLMFGALTIISDWFM